MARLTDDGINVARRRREVPQEPAEPAQVATPDPEPETPGDEPSQGGLVAEVAELSANEVMDRVEAGEWDPAEVYVAEEDGKGRVTLLRSLESFAAGQ